MAENNNNTTTTKKEQKATGQTRIAEEVVATIAGLATEKTEGVASMSGGITQGIAERLGRKSFTRGIKVEVGEKEAAADLRVIVNFGVKIHEVAESIRQNAREAIETMTGLTVVEINVSIDGVTFEEDKEKSEIEVDSTPKRVQ